MISHLIDLYETRGITLDDFQIEAVEALVAGRDVLVSAPTGAGKTVVAECAVEMALASQTRCIYTAPIKALSNQKYADLAARYGSDTVGLLTGDQTINPQAPIIVVTTEVLRNMLFARDVTDVGYAVLDEVHFLADPFRGPVWEEIILQLPHHIRLVSLSATIANIDEFSAWLRSVRGVTTTVVSTHRPVPLRQYVARRRRLIDLYDADGHLNGALSGAQPVRRGRQIQPEERRRILELLCERDMTPAIHFIFSRKGCDRAVGDLLDAGVVLTTRDEAKEIGRRMKELRASLSESDARAVRFGFWSKAFSRGFAAHHAGMFPALKELAEELMDAGLLRLVYATGTLALGIDMPVRTVVLESLQKWNGADFVDLNATEYTQLIGRAGRRGKDTHGNAVVISGPDLDLDMLADVGSGRVDPLESAFFPSYNTVVNLLAFKEYADARALMGTSFAQYQRNADLGQIEARSRRIRARIHELTQDLAGECDRGDVAEYLRLRQRAGRASKAERKRAKAQYRRVIEESWRAAHTGRLYAYARDGELEYGVVLSAGDKKLRLVNLYAEMVWLHRDELSAELRDLGAISLPFGLSPKDPTVRETIAESIIDAVDERISLGVDRDLEGSWDRFAVRETPEVVGHPVHTCPDVEDHVRVGRELLTLENALVDLEQTRDSYEGSVAREFDATSGILLDLGFLQRHDSRYKLSAGAQLLRGIHAEADLLITLCLSEPAVATASAEEFAGICSAFLSDRRLGDDLPRDAHLRAAWKAIDRNVTYLRHREADAGIERTPEPGPGAMEAFTLWARGGDLQTVLDMSKLTVGDFISATRRLIDLLGQISDSGVFDTAAQARELLRRWDWI